MSFDFEYLIESDQTELVDSVLKSIITKNQKELEEMANSGSANYIPKEESFQYYMITETYLDYARVDKIPSTKLWKYVITLAASQKTEDSKENQIVISEIKKEFPNLSKSISDYLIKYTENNSEAKK